MRIRDFSEADGWTSEGPKIDAPKNLEAIRRVLEKSGPIIVEHWFYRGASAPDRICFDDFEDFEEYLKTRAMAGDIIDVWNFADVCTRQNMIVSGKCPDDKGRVPTKGAY